MRLLLPIKLSCVTLFFSCQILEPSIAKIANNTQSALELHTSFLISSDLKKVIEPEEKENLSLGWGPTCVTRLSIQATDDIYSGMTLTIGQRTFGPYKSSLPCGDIRIIIGHDVIDKYKLQGELQSLKNQLAALQAKKFSVGLEVTAQQLMEHQKIIKELQDLQKEIADRENLIAEFDKKLADLQNLLPSLRKDSPSHAAQLETRIDATLKTGKLVRSLTLYPPVGGGYGLMTKWPGIYGETEVWRSVQGGRNLDNMLAKDPSQWQFLRKD